MSNDINARISAVTQLTAHVSSRILFNDYVVSLAENTTGKHIIVSKSGEEDQVITWHNGADGVSLTGAVLNSDYTLTLSMSNGTSYTTPSIRGVKGDNGVGIASTVLNSNHTLTITYTDGTTYTTGSIKGDKGDAGHSPVVTATKENGVTHVFADDTEIASINDGVKGDTGAAFTYADFTQEQLNSLKVKGDKGETGAAFTYADFTEEQLEALKVKGDKGEKGAAFTYDDFTDAQLEALKVKGDKGDDGNPGVYIGTGDMPLGYNVQIDPDGDSLSINDAIDELTEDVSKLQHITGSTLPTPSATYYRRTAIITESGTDTIYMCLLKDSEYVWRKIEV